MITENEDNENQQPLSTAGSTGEKEDEMGGTTNLSIDQLKQEGDNNGPPEDNPDRIENPDDLHEIEVDDDLFEPDVNAAGEEEEEISNNSDTVDDGPENEEQHS